ncbi:MAG: 2-dehydro-3-deoxy-D-gluconate 5-dehydrogenase KduD [Devosia sp.]|nr:2-dehydro-3-deoxy-D-gluconate 5-dehydrogenase KduD [Devosia sp.]
MNQSAFSLERRNVIVTGANTGIGQGIALAIAEAGGHVIGIARSSMDETADLIARAGGELTPIHCDLGDTSAARALLAELLARHGPVHGLVNNAGIIRRADALQHSEADWDDVLQLNLKLVFVLSQAFAAAAIERGHPARIVNIASLLSFQGGIRVAAYAASKHGVAGLTKAMANEWTAHGINVNAIAPGYVTSNNTEALRNDPDRSAAILARIPAARWGTPADIANVAVFLLAEASSYMSGAIVPVDGGWLGR